MIIKKIFPDKILRPYIDYYLYIKGSEKQKFMFLPDNINVLTFQLSGNTNAIYSGTSSNSITTRISGAFTDKRYFHTSDSFEVIMVFMEPYAIFSLFGAHLREFKNEIISLSDIATKNRVGELTSRMFEMENFKERIKLFEVFLKTIILQNTALPYVIPEAVNLIHSKMGLLSSPLIAEYCNVSQRTLERLFNQVIGLNVKEYSSLIRLKSAVSHLKDFSMLTDVAYDAKFFDQSHFNRFFKKYTGISPGRFVKTEMNSRQVVDFLQLYAETVE